MPATFLTFVCVSYFLIAPYPSGGLDLNPVIGYVAGTVAALALFVWRIVSARKATGYCATKR
ncbi:hypothetical protein B5F83_01160 [Muribaculum sp. An289]|nr:hypothetical protein B5F83_01160 [Muribaculum sp. An289]OUO43992.1 hypothetical protein B5F81_02135 [Muribaculum sp. An287]